jgi:iron complex outermembrane receptor protein
MKNQLISKKKLLSKAIAFALIGSTASPLFAAEEKIKEKVEETIEVIEVKGFRQSLASSIAIKQESTSFVEAISAEDIGKLPDVSIAESLSRLPGLAGQRVNGRAQVISIRGMGPDFTTTLLNGRQQASSGDNRAPEFDQYPSELINGAVVYKSADASVVGMGLAWGWRVR